MLTGLESIGNTSTSLGTNWQQGTSGQSSGPICIGKTKKIPARHMYALGTVFTA